jgi:sulfotransferase family protein
VSVQTRLLYVLGPSHSGTTLLALLLGSHPAIATVGELKQTSLGDRERYRCSCGVEIRRCPFWAAVREDLREGGSSFEPGDGSTDLAAGRGAYIRRLLRPLHRGPAFELTRDVALHAAPGWRGHLARWQRANARLAEAVCRLTGKAILVDSSKVAVRLKYLLRNPALDVRVLRVIRDGRAVMLTYMDPARFADARDERLRGGGSGGDRAAERLSATRAALEWRRSNEEAACALRGLPPVTWREVRYEQLCADPQATLAPVLSWLGVDPGVRVELARGAYHVIGNGMRLDSTREVRLDDRWTMALPQEALDAFDSVAGDLNRRLGYA